MIEAEARQMCRMLGSRSWLPVALVFVASPSDAPSAMAGAGDFERLHEGVCAAAQGHCQEGRVRTASDVARVSASWSWLSRCRMNELA